MKKWIVGGLGISSVVLVPVLFIVGLIGIALLATFMQTNHVEQNQMYSTDMSNLAANEIPAQFIQFYQDAGEKYGVNWLLLASIHKQETNFSSNKTVSSAGAVGSMQFMDCTFVGWSYPSCSGLGNGKIPSSVLTSPSQIAKYGGYGVDANGDGKADPWDDEDAIHSAANYVSANLKGATEQEKIKHAIWQYNHSDAYVAEVFERFELYTDGYVAVKNEAFIVNGKAWPVPYTNTITSYYGPRWGRLHAGIDIASPGVNGQPIVAFADGKVTRSEYNRIVHSDGSEGGWGWYVRVDHGNGLSTVYGHMIKKGIAVGTEVKAGTTIGYVGSTGGSTGPHLHFEVHENGVAVNPIPYVQDLLP